MKLFVVSSSSPDWWDALNDLVILASSEGEALEMADSKFESYQKPLTVQEFSLDRSQIVFENFDLG